MTGTSIIDKPSSAEVAAKLGIDIPYAKIVLQNALGSPVEGIWLTTSVDAAVVGGTCEVAARVNVAGEAPGLNKHITRHVEGVSFLTGNTPVVKVYTNEDPPGLRLI